MKGRLAVLVALAAGVMLASTAAAGPDAAKQRVAITSVLTRGTFVLSPLQNGALKRDSGRISGVYSTTPKRVVIRDGQKVMIHPAVWTLKGKRGTLTIRERSEWFDAGQPLIGTGIWKVVRGTGEYTGITGGGRSAHAGLNRGTRPWYARHEGFLTLP